MSLNFIIIFSLLVACNLHAQPITPDMKFDAVFKLKIQSSILDEQRELFIYVPTTAEPNKSFPVLYVLDGERTDRFKKAIKAAGTNKKYPNHIIVGIENKIHRNRDMIPIQMESRPTAGGGEQFYEFLTNELIPFIDSSFSTNGMNILYGASTAGLFTLYAMLQSPENISGYIANSPMVGHCPDFLHELTSSLEPNAENNISLFIQYGKKDRFRQVVDYLPDFYDHLNGSTKETLKTELKTYTLRGHVPKKGFKNGLNLIYN